MSIDTLKASKAGFTEEQIEVLQESDDKYVTKDYFDVKLAALESKLDTQIKIAIGLGIAIFIKSFF